LRHLCGSKRFWSAQACLRNSCGSKRPAKVGATLQVQGALLFGVRKLACAIPAAANALPRQGPHSRFRVRSFLECASLLAQFLRQQAAALQNFTHWPGRLLAPSLWQQTPCQGRGRTPGSGCAPFWSAQACLRHLCGSKLPHSRISLTGQGACLRHLCGSKRFWSAQACLRNSCGSKLPHSRISLTDQGACLRHLCGSKRPAKAGAALQRTRPPTP
jgi:hypothetical protein